MRRFVERIPIPETRIYVKRVLGRHRMYAIAWPTDSGKYGGHSPPLVDGSSARSQDACTARSRTSTPPEHAARQRYCGCSRCARPARMKRIPWSTGAPARRPQQEQRDPAISRKPSGLARLRASRSPTMRFRVEHALEHEARVAGQASGQPGRAGSPAGCVRCSMDRCARDDNRLRVPASNRAASASGDALGAAGERSFSTPRSTCGRWTRPCSIALDEITFAPTGARDAVAAAGPTALSGERWKAPRQG